MSVREQKGWYREDVVYCPVCLVTVCKSIEPCCWMCKGSRLGAR